MKPRSLQREQAGAVIVEQLVAFLPVLFFALATVQILELCTASLLMRHAAFCAARAAIVVLPDDPRRYGGERAVSRSEGLQNFAKYGDPLKTNVAFPNRFSDIRKAAVTVLETDKHFATNDLYMNFSYHFNTEELEVAISAPYACFAPFVNIVCAPWGRRLLHATGIDTFQGANYAY